MQDFVDVVVPILEAGTWTNLGRTPSIVPMVEGSGIGKSSVRGNKNERIEVRNASGGMTEVTFDSVPIIDQLSGTISIISTDKTDRNKMKKDLYTVLRTGGLGFAEPSFDDNPNLRNKHAVSFQIQILN